MTDSSENSQNLSAALEAILFIYGEPLEIKKIAKILNIEIANVKGAVEDLEKELTRENRGLFLIQHEEKVQLSTKPELKELLERITKEEFSEILTPAALETLSIIAYTGPLSRAELEYVRGVNSSFILRSLLLRGLVERRPDSRRANAYVYSPSFELLRYFGVSKVEDLPDYDKYKELAKIFTKPQNVQNAEDIKIIGSGETPNPNL